MPVGVSFVSVFVSVFVSIRDFVSVCRAFVSGCVVCVGWWVGLWRLCRVLCRCVSVVSGVVSIVSDTETDIFLASEFFLTRQYSWPRQASFSVSLLNVGFNVGCVGCCVGVCRLCRVLCRSVSVVSGVVSVCVGCVGLCRF